MIKKKFKIPIYHQTLIVIQTDDFKAVEKQYGLDSTREYDGFVFKYNGDIIVVFNYDVTYGIMVHEAVHIVNYIFSSVSMHLDTHNDETQAYLTEYVAELILKVIKIGKKDLKIVG